MSANTSFYLSESTGSRIRILAKLLGVSLGTVLNTAAREYVEKYADDITEFEEQQNVIKAKIEAKVKV